MFNVSSLLLDDALKLATPLINGAISGVAGLSASSSSKMDTLNICFTDVSRTIIFPDRRYPDRRFPDNLYK